MEYKIVFSKRRTLAIKITSNCEIIVYSPKGKSKQDIENFVLKHQNWVLKSLEIQKSKMQRYPELSENDLLNLTSLARDFLPAKVELFSEIMGVKPSKVSINRAKTRFGSCSSKGRINFSCRLMRYPEKAIDYVVVHELAHLKHLNHSKDFWSFVEKFMPDYKERKKLLR